MRLSENLRIYFSGIGILLVLVLLLISNSVRIPTTRNYFMIQRNSNFTTCRPRSRLTGKTSEKVHFIYIALQKTGSRATRRELLNYCSHRNLRCLSYHSCGNGSKTVNFNNYKFLKCSGHNYIFDPDNVARCCKTLKLPQGTCQWDALVDHFNISHNHPEKLQFLLKNIPANAFHFASFRNPIHQFISWRNHHCKNKPWYRKHMWFCKEANISNVISRHYNEVLFWNDNLANSQSRFLGFDGTQKSLDEKVFPLMESLDFVLISDRLRESWCVLKKLLKWPEKFFNLKKAHSSPEYDVDPESARKLRQVQWADFQVFRKAQNIFDTKFQPFRKYCT